MVGAPPRVVIVVVRHRPRVVIVGFGTLLESLSWCKPVLESLSWFDVLLVSISWYKPWFSRLHWSAEPTLLSLFWYKPGGKVTCRNSRRGAGQYALFCRSLTPVTIVVQTVVPTPPRVANMVQTGGETLAGKPVDVSVSIR